MLLNRSKSFHNTMTVQVVSIIASHPFDWKQIWWGFKDALAFRNAVG